MKNIFKKAGTIATVAFYLLLPSCSLDEENPGGSSLENIAATVEGYQSIINQCYVDVERYQYGSNNWMLFVEGNTDLWTYAKNQQSWKQWFWYFSGAAPDAKYDKDFWAGFYSGIGTCNTAISLADDVPFDTEEERNAKVAEAHFLRAMYYYNAVELFGAVTLITEPATTIDYHPERTDPFKIYEEVIIPDLEFAFEWLPVGDDNTTTIPTKKAALGFLAKACLQTVEHDNTNKYASKALQYAKMLIEDAEAGGSQYNAYLYPTYDEVFDEANNYSNKEALWKHRWNVSDAGSGAAGLNSYDVNKNHTYFYCSYTAFFAREDVQESRLTWGGNGPGMFMPTQHLLNLYVQDDGTLDPRYHKSFQTEWDANVKFRWEDNTGQSDMFDKEESVSDDSLLVGDLAIKFVMPQDDDYASEVASKLSKPYIVADYKDVYSDEDKNVKMTYAYTNPSGNYSSDGTSENPFKNFYPSLTKHNSSNYYVVQESRKRNANLNATFIMRMAEVYLIAAEADIYANGGANALGYINKIRQRAGANDLTGTPTIDDILDERGRELCGEYCRFFDLKRTGKLDDETYLNSTHPDLGQFFKPEYALKPIPTTFLETLEGGGTYYQNPGY